MAPNKVFTLSAVCAKLCIENPDVRENTESSIVMLTSDEYNLTTVTHKNLHMALSDACI